MPHVVLVAEEVMPIRYARGFPLTSSLVYSGDPESPWHVATPPMI